MQRDLHLVETEVITDSETDEKDEEILRNTVHIIDRLTPL